MSFYIFMTYLWCRGYVIDDELVEAALSDQVSHLKELRVRHMKGEQLSEEQLREITFEEELPEPTFMERNCSCCCFKLHDS